MGYLRHQSPSHMWPPPPIHKEFLCTSILEDQAEWCNAKQGIKQSHYRKQTASHWQKDEGDSNLWQNNSTHLLRYKHYLLLWQKWDSRKVSNISTLADRSKCAQSWSNSAIVGDRKYNHLFCGGQCPRWHGSWPAEEHQYRPVRSSGTVTAGRTHLPAAHHVTNGRRCVRLLSLVLSYNDRFLYMLEKNEKLWHHISALIILKVRILTTLYFFISVC